MGFREYDLPQLSVGEELVDLTVSIGKRRYRVLRLFQQRPITITLLVQATESGQDDSPLQVLKIVRFLTDIFS
jgi:hypothetical protein